MVILGLHREICYDPKRYRMMNIKLWKERGAKIQNIKNNVPDNGTIIQNTKFTMLTNGTRMLKARDTIVTNTAIDIKISSRNR